MGFDEERGGKRSKWQCILTRSMCLAWNRAVRKLQRRLAGRAGLVEGNPLEEQLKAKETSTIEIIFIHRKRDLIVSELISSGRAFHSTKHFGKCLSLPCEMVLKFLNNDSGTIPSHWFILPRV